jgi:hypothetical protein
MSKKYIGEVGVDSGQLMITDPCYIDSFDTQKNANFDESLPEGIDLNNHHNEEPLDNYPYTYGGACGASCNSDRGAVLSNNGQKGWGACFSTGYGDGSYPVYLTYNDDGRVKSVTIEFMEDEYEDEEW